MPGRGSNVARLYQPCCERLDNPSRLGTTDTAVAHSVFGWSVIKFLLRNTLRRAPIRS